jgi:spore maturation protein CgeB
MKVVIFCHSLISDWNHGNAHFLRGIAAELIARSCDVVVYEPADSWSRRQLVADAGEDAVARFSRAFPRLTSIVADFERLDLDEALDGADVVLVHEWNPHGVVAAIGRHRARSGRYVLLFHDTHHRSVTDAVAMARYALENYDGVLAFGEVIRQRYLSLGWASRAWTWHEGADTRAFRPMVSASARDDLVWIGNWGDDERSAELRSYLIEPVRDLALRATVYGVRYPHTTKAQLNDAGIRYGGWLPNYEVPQTFGRHRVTVHIPRRPYANVLPGIPTIRVFEALACGIPLVCTEWHDVEGLFTPGADFLVASSPAQMRRHLAAVCADVDLRLSLIEHGLATIRSRHTCAHRVDELLAVFDEVRQGASREVVST